MTFPADHLIHAYELPVETTVEMRRMRFLAEPVPVFLHLRSVRYETPEGESWELLGSRHFVNLADSQEIVLDQVSREGGTEAVPPELTVVPEGRIHVELMGIPDRRAFVYRIF